MGSGRRECGRPDSASLENALFSTGDSPRSGFRQMTGLPVGRCPNCGAAVSYFAWSCPNCHRRNLPNPVAATAAVVAVLVAGGGPGNATTFLSIDLVKIGRAHV